ncbi:ion transporter [bacterium]|nr:ion transporter [bacterium]
MKLRMQLREIIFGTHTRAGRAFDMALIWLILLSVTVVCFDSVQSYHDRHGDLLLQLEWCFTIIFTIEYLLRIYCSRRPARYMTSFFGVVDLLAIIPTYLSLFALNTQFLIVIRALRLIRVFRVLQLAQFMGEAYSLRQAINSSRHKITVFLLGVLITTIVAGSIMYIIEGASSGFTSIPRGIYWAIVTITTVGYGDISPQTPLGQLISSILMICGYGILAVPTGIVSAQLAQGQNMLLTGRSTGENCILCLSQGHDEDARFCKICGRVL